MAARAFVSRFSPNRTDPKVLEAIFVQRHKLAEVWLGRLKDSVLGGAKHHLLAVGPRGCGKSHLVVLLVSRLRQDPAVREKVRIAWLPEDETTPSFWKFLLRILRALNAEYGDEFPPPPRDKLERAADDRRADVLSKYLLEKLGQRTLLVVVENLDEVMKGLKLEGQKRWRSFLQEHPVAATLATTQQLTKDVSDRDRPFFGFFQVERLRPLSADEALELLRKLADHGGNADLAAFLQTPTGRARVRAIRHIAGGSHRVFIILSEFATRENLDDLVTAFEELLDELTPYYQERLRWLPDQQREIVEFLCRQAQTVQVKEIAAELFLTEQAAAAQLKALKDKGYVTAESVGRESRYELSEPLMRLCVEVKDPQREPIRLIVQFLQIWYDRAGVEERLRNLPPDAELERRYFQAALQAHRPGIPGPVEEALNRDLDAARATGDPEKLAMVLTELAATDNTSWRCLGIANELNDLGRHEEALAACDRAIELDPTDDPAFHNRGVALCGLGRHEEALAAFDRTIELDPKDAVAFHNRSFALFHLARYAEALAASERAIELVPKYSPAFHNRGSALFELGRHEEAMASYDRTIELDPGYKLAWANRGEVKLDLGQIDEALDDLRRAMTLGESSPRVFETLTKAYLLRGDWDAAEQALSERFRLPAAPGQPKKSRPLPGLIATLFGTSSDRRVWRRRVARLAEIGEEARRDHGRIESEGKMVPSGGTSISAPPPLDPLALIGDALVRSLTNRAYAEATADALDAWAGAWREVAKEHRDLSLAARLFGVGVRYVATKDERVLLDLVQEERSILCDLFGLSDGPGEG